MISVWKMHYFCDLREEVDGRFVGEVYLELHPHLVMGQKEKPKQPPNDCKGLFYSYTNRWHMTFEYAKKSDNKEALEKKKEKSSERRQNTTKL